MSDRSDARRRILVVTSSFPRWTGDASGAFVLAHAQGLAACGWAVDVLAPHAPGAAVREAFDGIRVERFRYLWPAGLQTLCYGGGVLGNLRRNRLNLLKVPPLVLGEWAALLRRLARRRYALVNSHWIMPQGLTAAFAAPLVGVPHVTTVHGSDVLALTGGVMSAVNRFTLRRADAVTVNSAATRAGVEAIAPGLGHVHTIAMGIATETAPDDAAVGRLRAAHRRGAGPLLGFVGRVVREKGVGDLIEAVARLASAHPDVTAVVVGDGADRVEFETQAKALGIADRIAFVGQVPPGAVADYMAAADVLVGPSWTEAFGLVFAEALNAGTPVVAADVGGVGECVAHGTTGLLVPPRDPEAIAAAVTRFVCDPAFAARTVREGRALVRHRFDAKAAAGAFSDLFEAVLRGRGEPAPRPADAAAGQR